MTVEQVEITQRMVSAGGVKVPQRVLIPTVAMLEKKIAAVPAGGFRGVTDIRAELAQEHGTDITCPMIANRHLKAIVMASHAAFTAGEVDAVPFWRVVDADKPAAWTLAGGVDFILTRRAAEGAG